MSPRSADDERHIEPGGVETDHHGMASDALAEHVPEVPEHGLLVAATIVDHRVVLVDAGAQVADCENLAGEGRQGSPVLEGGERIAFGRLHRLDGRRLSRVELLQLLLDFRGDLLFVFHPAELHGGRVEVLADQLVPFDARRIELEHLAKSVIRQRPGLDVPDQPVREIELVVEICRRLRLGLRGNNRIQGVFKRIRFHFCGHSFPFR